jgi:hypothetical protein
MKNHVTVILQRESVEALAKVPAGCVNARSARLGVYEGEPLLVIADALLSYAKSYKARFEGDEIGNDHFACEPFKDMLRGCRAMLDMDGGVALRRGITTDSKDNGSICDILDAAAKVAGINSEDL